MFYPDYLAPFAEPFFQAQQFRDRAVQTWQEVQPRLIDAGVMVAGVVLTTIALTAFAGRQTRKGFDWLYPRLRAAYDAFCDYRETPWYESWEAALPDPADYFGNETMPQAETFEEYAAIREQPIKADPNEPIALPAPKPPDCEDPFGMDNFDPIPAADPDELPTVPDLREEITPQDVKTERRRGRPRKAE